MRIGTVLVSKDGYYIGPNGELPKGRPKGDKEFITSLVKGKVVLCSKNTLNNLPLSIIKEAKRFTHNPKARREVNFGISTFKEFCDIFIIVRTEEDMGDGSVFKYEYIEENYNKIFDLNNIILYVNKHTKIIKDNTWDF